MRVLDVVGAIHRSDPPRESRSHKAIEVHPEQMVATSGDTVTAVLSQDKPGSYSWWIGVQGSKLGGASYTLVARSVRPCPRGCSGGRGECDVRTGRCFCRAGARGTDCSQSETTSAHVTFGEPLLSHVASPGWAFHALQVIPSSVRGELQVELLQECLPSDLEHNRTATGLGLYLGDRRLPSASEYSMRDDTPGSARSSLSVVVQGGHSQEWHVGITVGEDACRGYTLTASVVKSCLGPCSNQGSCVEGQCRCHQGFRGDDCSELDAPEPTALTWRRPVEQSFTSPEWRVFYVDINPTTAIAWLHVEIHSLEATPGEGCASLEVLLRPDELPTPHVYALQVSYRWES